MKLTPDEQRVIDLKALDRGETKHTPGPWHWKRNRTMQSLYAGAFGLGVYVPTENNTSYPLEVRNSIEGNARLIAAAPELLEAARKFIEIRHKLDSGITIGYSEAFDMAERAIAKAEEK
jgi:hypothetical protein